MVPDSLLGQIWSNQVFSLVAISNCWKPPGPRSGRGNWRTRAVCLCWVPIPKLHIWIFSLPRWQPGTMSDSPGHTLVSSGTGTRQSAFVTELVGAHLSPKVATYQVIWLSSSSLWFSLSPCFLVEMLCLLHGVAWNLSRSYTYSTVNTKVSCKYRFPS